MRLDDATPAQLVEALGNDNMFWRLTAQQLLVERGETDVVPSLVAMVDDHTIDAQGLNPRALHALWTLEGLGAVASDAGAQAAVRRALHHPAASLRRAALQVLARDERLEGDVFAAGILPDRSSPHAVDLTVSTALLQDADAQVRVAALLALSEVPGSARSAAAIVDMAMAPQNARDPWLPDALAIAGVKQDPSVVTDLLARRPAAQDSTYLAGLRTTVRLMTRYYAAQENTDVIVAVLRAVPEANPTVASGALDAIGGGERIGAPGWPEDSPPNLTPEQRQALAGAARAAAEELKAGFARIAERWGMPELFAGPGR
jgi:hypothetical protein